MATSISIHGPFIIIICCCCCRRRPSVINS
jgi:hypothetical protein